MIAEPDLDMTEGDYQRAKTMSLSKAQWHEHLEDLERQAIVNLDAKIKALSEEILRLRKENRKLQLSLDKAMVIVRAKAPKIKSELDILHELERVELSHDVEYMRKLREAVIRWRAIAEYGGGMEGQDYESGFEDLEEEGNDPDPENTTTWGQKEFLANAERLLLEEGVI